MRGLYIYLPILLVLFSACKIKQAPIPDLRFPAFKKAESFFDVNNDSAFYYFNAIASGTTDSLQKATAYTYTGIIQNREGDYYGGQESLLTALSYLDERQEAHRYCLQSTYHELAVSNQFLRNYDAAIGYSNRALPFTVSNDFRIMVLNSLALTYQKNGNYRQADSIYLSVLDSIRNNPKEYARVLSNLARTRWLQDHRYLAKPDLLRALFIRETLKDKWGLNASYTHLSDYYTDTRPDSALYYARKRDTIAYQLKSTDDQLEALSKLLTLSPPQQIKQYIARYQQLNDSVQTARNAAKNQFALVRYETEKSKADNLLLQKDNAQKNVQLLQQQAVILCTLVFFVAAIIVVRNWYRKRRQQMEAAARLTIQESQLKTSQKVHDVVANGLYRVMTGIEHKDTIDKEQLLDEIEVLYERSRNISYEPPEVPHLDFQSTISGMLKAFGSPTTNVYVTGNSQSLWDRITPQAQLEVEQIMQELMVNMKKHSQADNVVVKFETLQNSLQIFYSDDGVGLPINIKYGNGLTNTGNRIKGIGGNITFGETTKGLKICISIPTVSTT